jgi:drug/metabolite transporter (DMT)-like permease
VIIVTVGLALFSCGKWPESSLKGIGLGIVSLFSDAIYVPVVDRLKAAEGGAFVTMFYSYTWSIVFIVVFRFREITHSFVVLGSHRVFLRKLSLFGLTGCLPHFA